MEAEEEEKEAEETRPRRVSLSQPSLDAEALRERLGRAETEGPSVLGRPSDAQRRLSFEIKRREHYDEGSRIQEAKRMIAQELASIDDDD